MLALTNSSENYAAPRYFDYAASRSVEKSPLGFEPNTYSVAAKQDIFVEGDSASFVYEIVEGTVAAYRILTDGERHVVSFYFAGDILGYCGGHIHAMSAHAITTVRLRRVSVSSVDRMLDERPDLARRLLRMAADELTATRDHLVCIAAKSAEAKMASFLLALSRRNAAIGLDPSELLLQMTRIDIGDYLGLTVETVSRTLTKMKMSGVIAIPRACRVLVKNRNALEAMANA